MSGWIVALIVVLLIIIAGYVAFRWAQSEFCSIPIIGLLCGISGGGGGGGTNQGASCTLDSDCAGWTLFGDIACCSSRCVTKDQSVETCAAFCADHPSVCGAAASRREARPRARPDRLA